MDSIRNALTSIKALLAWLPNPAVVAIILALAGTIAFLLHGMVRKLIRRLLAHRAPFVFSIFHPDARRDPAWAGDPGRHHRHSGGAGRLGHRRLDDAAGADRRDRVDRLGGR
jgi:hypothetical protein